MVGSTGQEKEDPAEMMPTICLSFCAFLSLWAAHLNSPFETL